MGEFRGRKSDMFDLKCFVPISRMWFLPRQGALFRRIIENMCGQEMKNGAKIMLDTPKYRQKGVGYIKMSSKLCWIHL